MPNSFLQFVEMQPSIGEHRSLYMLEFFGTAVAVSSSYPAEHLKVQLWTNALDKFNTSGDWHAIDLVYQQQDANGNLVFEGGFRPTSEGEYEFTYRAALHTAVALNQVLPGPLSHHSGADTHKRLSKEGPGFPRYFPTSPEWQWAGQYGQNGHLSIKLPSPRKNSDKVDSSLLR